MNEATSRRRSRTFKREHDEPEIIDLLDDDDEVIKKEKENVANPVIDLSLDDDEPASDEGTMQRTNNESIVKGGDDADVSFSGTRFTLTMEKVSYQVWTEKSQTESGVAAVTQALLQRCNDKAPAIAALQAATAVKRELTEHSVCGPYNAAKQEYSHVAGTAPPLDCPDAAPSLDTSGVLQPATELATAAAAKHECARVVRAVASVPCPWSGVTAAQRPVPARWFSSSGVTQPAATANRDFAHEPDRVVSGVAWTKPSPLGHAAAHKGSMVAKKEGKQNCRDDESPKKVKKDRVPRDPRKRKYAMAANETTSDISPDQASPHSTLGNTQVAAHRGQPQGNANITRRACVRMESLQNGFNHPEDNSDVTDYRYLKRRKSYRCKIKSLEQLNQRA